MALPLPVKVLSFVLFVGGIAGATYGVQLAVPAPDLEGQLLTTSFVHPTLNATPGQTATFAIEVVNRGESARAIRFTLEGEGVRGVSETRNVSRQERTMFFVPVEVDAATTGEKLLEMRIHARDGTLLRVRDDVATVRVLPPAVGLAQGDTADALFVGRLADSGAVFQTNDPAYRNKTFPQASNYQLHPRVLTITTQPVNVVRGFYDAILGMQPGETRTFTVTPETGYGNATDVHREPRTEPISRGFPIPLEEEIRPRSSFDRFLNESRQTRPGGYQTGDRFFVDEPQTGNRWPYRLLAINETEVRYVLDVKVDETYTLYPFWPKGSRVESVNETVALFNTTPTTAIGQRFQARSYWPNMTSVKEVGDAIITIEHSPPVNFRYTLPVRGQPIEHTVSQLTEEDIVITTPNPHPLSGKVLEFDVTLLTLTKKPE